MMRIALAASLAIAAAAAQAAPTLEELADIVAAQQDEIDRLKNESPGGSRTHIGGYGELHWNFVKDATDEVDFHRFVLFFGYDFAPGIRFRSELEIEHALAGDGKPGEVELEQAYVEFDLPEAQVARAGLMLVPVGILNETHEPPTFYGVERNRIESVIIPATWWEAGAAIGGRFGSSGFGYDLFVHSGLKIDIDSSNPIRGGRQKVAEATANDPAATLRLRYQGTPGVELATTVQYQGDVSQTEDDDVGSAVLLSGHVAINRGMFGLRALYAQWNIEGEEADALDKDRIRGWYVEPSLRVLEQLGLFVRFSEHEIVRDEQETNTTFGVNWWPHPQVVLKLDHETRELPDDSERESVNLGVGYQF